MDLAFEVLACADPEPEQGAPELVGRDHRVHTVKSAEGKSHRVYVGPDEVTLDLAVTACGWRFGGSTAKLSFGLPEPTYKSVCA